MAKKEKKQKKQREKKRGLKRGSRRAVRREPESNIPYPDSDRTKDCLVKMLIVLCFITIGMMIYTIHYMKYVDEKAQEEADRVAAETAAKTPSVGSIWFTKPDGTVVGETGAPYTPGAPASSQPPLPSASLKTPAAEKTAEEPAAGAEEPAAAAEGEAAEPPEEPPVSVPQ